MPSAHVHPPATRDAPEPSHADAGTLALLRTGIALALLVPWLVYLAIAVYTHRGAQQSADRRMERLAAVAHEHALKLFETSDLLTKQVDQLVGPLDGDALLARPDLGTRLADLTRGMSQVHSIWVLDAQGRGVLSTRSRPAQPPDFSDSVPWRAHRDQAGQLLLTPPRRGSITGEVFFDLSRRREDAQGRFLGTTQVGLYPDYFTSFWRELADAEQGVVMTLLHPDGRLIARWPRHVDPGSRLAPQSPMLPAMARSEPAGRVRAVSTFDGVARVGTYRRVGQYPAYVFAGMAEAAALAGWRRDMGLLAAFILPLSLGLALIGWQALRRTRRHIEAARALQLEAHERQRVEAALRQSQKLEAMGHLTGGVAHDFNNLLMVVNLNATLLRGKLQGAGVERQLEAIERAVAAGKKLTRQLLAFSRRQPLLPRVLDLGAQLPALLDLVRPALGSQIELVDAIAPGVHPVRLDSGELELALINLAVNARDAMPDGGQLRVALRNADPGWVELSVADTGVGIDPKDIERVFEPFFTTKPVGSGTGLGLAQVYALCARAGGSARVESQRGIGTTVVLRFPALPGAQAEDATAARPAQALERLSLRVLLVEDNADIASATREVLEAAGCDVVHVQQPSAALATLQDDPDFHVVLSDIVMPGGMDGLQLCDELRRRRPQLPVVLMTGYAEKLGEAEAQGLVVLPKPFEPQLLLRTLREQLQAGSAVLGD